MDDYSLFHLGRNRERLLHCFFMISVILPMILVSLSPVHGEMGDHPKVVKVGYFETGRFQEGSNDSEEKSGLAYEYMQQIANYAGWKCEYVYGSWHEVYQKLVKGEIDVMADVSYSKERNQQMLFSSVPFVQENYYLFVPKSKIGQYEGIESLKGKTVGVTKGLIQADMLKAWNKRYHAGLVLKYYKTSKARIEAYKAQKTDMTLTVSLSTWEDGKNVPLRYIDSSNAYTAVSKKRPDLLEEANQAMATLASTVPH